MSWCPGRAISGLVYTADCDIQTLLKKMEPQLSRTGPLSKKQYDQLRNAANIRVAVLCATDQTIESKKYANEMLGTAITRLPRTADIHFIGPMITKTGPTFHRMDVGEYLGPKFDLVILEYCPMRGMQPAYECKAQVIEFVKRALNPNGIVVGINTKEFIDAELAEIADKGGLTPLEPFPVLLSEGSQTRHALLIANLHYDRPSVGKVAPPRVTLPPQRSWWWFSGAFADAANPNGSTHLQ